MGLFVSSFMLGSLGLCPASRLGGFAARSLGIRAGQTTDKMVVSKEVIRIECSSFVVSLCQLIVAQVSGGRSNQVERSGTTNLPNFADAPDPAKSSSTRPNSSSQPCHEVARAGGPEVRQSAPPLRLDDRERESDVERIRDPWPSPLCPFRFPFVSFPFLPPLLCDHSST